MGQSSAPVIHCQNLARLQRRRIKNPPFPGAGQATPLPRWKLLDEIWSMKTPVRAGRSGVGESSAGCPASDSSARKLAAALWHLAQVADVGDGAWQRSSGDRLGLERNLDRIPSNSETTLQTKLEGVTKWDYSIYCNHGDDKKLHEDQSMYAAAISPAAEIVLLQEELQRARSRIDELESERHLAKQKLDRVLMKLAEEKASLRSRDQNEKLRDVIKAIKEDLHRERRSRRKMEVLNSQLVNELAEAKLMAKQHLQEYEKERTAREVAENACDELAKGIGDGKAKVESLKRESMEIQEELEGERRMLQMAEVWREERVQMKLVDAKLLLEEKYAELMKLRAHLDSFLMAHANDCSRNADNDLVLREATMLKEAADSIKLHEIELYYRSPSPVDNNNFSVFFDQLQPRINQTDEQRDTGHRDHEDARDDGDRSCSESSMLAEGRNSCTGQSEKRDDSNMDAETSEICSATSRKKPRKKLPSSIGRFWRFTGNGSIKKPPEELPNGCRVNGTDSSSPAARTDDHRKVKLRQVLENRT